MFRSAAELVLDWIGFRDHSLKSYVEDSTVFVDGNYIAAANLPFRAKLKLIDLLAEYGYTASHKDSGFDYFEPPL
jgi:hypothetical protein